MFSKKPGTDTSPLAASRVAGGSTFSVLGADTAIRGNVSASADLHIDGRVEGDVACATIVQGETSEIVGAVRAQSARLAGSIHGTIEAEDLVILKSARIHGDVHYDRLTIEQGAQVDGRFAPRSEASEPGSEGHLILASAQG